MSNQITNKIFDVSGDFKTLSTPNSDEIIIAGYANTVDKDRGRDKIAATAWIKGVQEYRKNPILLFQHNQNNPIGKVTKLTVDRKGLYIEAVISKTAQNVIQLVKEKVLKAFSVGFRIVNSSKNFSNGEEDGYTVKELELLEISIVSIPANQNSLFSIKKSFDSDEEYTAFLKATVDNTKDIRAGITDNTGNHYHAVEVDENGNGTTTYSSHGETHIHQVKDGKIIEVEDHTHDTIKWVEVNLSDNITESIPLIEGEDMDIKNEIHDINEAEVEENKSIEAEEIHEEEIQEKEIELEHIEEKELEIEEELSSEEDEEDNDPYALVPFVNLLSAETAGITNGRFIKYKDARWMVTKIATSSSPIFYFVEVDINGNKKSNTTSINAQDLNVVNIWDIDNHSYDLVVFDYNQNIKLTMDKRQEIISEFKTLVNTSLSSIFSLKDSSYVKNQKYLQNKVNNIINLLNENPNDWTDTDFIFADRMSKSIENLLNYPESDDRNKVLNIYGHHLSETKEHKDMATQVIGEPVLNTNASDTDTEVTSEKEIKTKDVSDDKTVTKEAVSEEKTEKSTVDVAYLGNQIEELLKTLKKETTKAADKDVDTTDDVEMLKSEVQKYKEQVSALYKSKMEFEQNNVRTTSPYTELDIANATILAKLKGISPEQTAIGQDMLRTKAITSTSQFISTFSSSVYEEMEQELTIVPLFESFNVKGRQFVVPVSDEDTDGDVAQFASGTYATGPDDTTRVPLSKQNTITAVTFTPHKFMGATHLAKDEEEDVILPLIEFQRSSLTRRMARAIDKAILRGDGTLSGFNQTPSGTVTVATGFNSVITGLSTLCTNVGAALQVDVGASDQVDPTDIATGRGAMGKYGLQVGENLTLLTTIEGYNDLVQTADFRTVDSFGESRATYLTGSLGAVYGIPIRVTEFLDNTGGASNHVAILVYRPGFKIAHNRMMEVESEYVPRTQTTAIYMSTRFDFHALTTESAAGLSATYPMAVLFRSA